MIKRKEYLHSDKTVKQLFSKIYSNLSYNSNSRFGSTKWFDEFSANLDSNKPFIGSVTGNKVELNGKGLRYWPSVYLTINEKEDGAQVHIIYGSWWLYTITYLVLLFFNIAIFVRAYNEHGIEEACNLLGFLPFLIGFAVYGKWLQNNSRNFLID